MKALTQIPNLICEEVFFRSWWVICFMLFSYFCYEQGLKKKDRAFEKLQTQFVQLNQELRQVTTVQEKLQGQLNSFDDPAWIERVLMEELGVVPEGQTKIYFGDT